MNAPRDWKPRDENNDFVIYTKGDVILKNGQTYVATRTTSVQDGSPEHGVKAGWRELLDNRSENYINSDTAPVNPSVGDEWYDTSVGKLFKYIDDSNSKQWVEI